MPSFRTHSRIPVFCLLLAFVSPAIITAKEQKTDVSKPVSIGNRRELFVDRALIDSLKDGAELRLHHPVPQEIAITHDAPWEGNASLYHTVLQDGDLYRMYYRGWNFDVSGKSLKVTHRPLVCYAESRDGVRFTRPKLELFEYEDSAENNIIWDGVGAHNFSPFIDGNPDCPADQRYKAVGGLHSEGGLFAFGSADGIHWKLLAEKPVITKGAFDSQNTAFWDAARGEYRSYQRTFSQGRDMTTCSSTDFLEWTEPELLSYTPERTTELYTNQITPYHRAPHLLLGFPTRYITGRSLLTPLNEQISTLSRRYGTDYSDGGFMAGRTASHFHMWGEAFLRPGPTHEATWVYGSTYQNYGLVETRSPFPLGPKELSIYSSEGYWRGPGVSMRRYTLRLDGFVSVNAPFTGGEVVTRPVIFTEEPATARRPAADSPLSGAVAHVTSHALQGGGSLQFRNPATLTIPQSKNLGRELTLACLVRDVPRGHRRLFSAYNGGPTTGGELYFDIGSTLGGMRFSYDGVSVVADAAAIARLYEEPDKPHHFAATWRDGEITLYFDGKPVAQGGEDGRGECVLSLGNLRFGEDYPPTSLANEPFLGTVDEVLWLKRALKAEDIAQLASRDAAGPINRKEDQGAYYTFEAPLREVLTDQLPADGHQAAGISGAHIPGEVELLVNYSTSAAGSVQCEIQDVDGTPIRGFSLADSDVTYGDEVEQPLTWNSSSEVKSLVGRPVRLRFVLKDADLYSFRFGRRAAAEAD